MRGKNINKDKIVDITLIFFLTIIFAYPVYLCGINALDEGTLLHVAERITKGEVLYRDVAISLMPGIYYLQAILFLIFGYSVEVGRYLQMVVLATNAAVLYLISCRFVNRGGSFVVVMLFVATNAFAYRFPNYCPLSILFILLSFLCFLCYLSQRKNTYILLSGFSLALSFLFKQNYGVLVFLPLTFLLIVKAFKERSFRPLALFLISFTLPNLFVLSYFYFHGALDDMVKYTVLSLFSKELSIYYKPYPFLNRHDPFYFMGDVPSYAPFPYLTDWLLANGFASLEFIYRIISVAYLVPPLILFISSVYVGIMLIKKSIWEKEVALLLVSIGLFLGVFPRADFHHLAIILPPLLVLGWFIMQRVCIKGWHYVRIPFSLLLVFCVCPFIFSVYLPIFSHTPIAQNTAVDTERAKGIKVEKVDAETIKAITSYVRERLKNDEEVLAVPSLPLYYFLSNRKSCTPYPLILPGSFDEDLFFQQISRASYIVYTDTAFEDIPFSTIFPRIYQYLLANYVVDKDFLSTLNMPMYRPVFILKRGKNDAMAASGLTSHLNDAGKGITKKNIGLVPLVGQDTKRVKQMCWLFKDSVALRPPSGFQKLFLTYKVIVPLMAKLHFSLALMPLGINANADGAVLEIHIYDTQSRQPLKIFTKYLDPKTPNVWRWQDFEIDLSGFAEKEVIMSFVCFSGPTLDEAWDEIYLGDPGIVTDGMNNELIVNKVGEFPEDVALEMGAFNDPGIFEQAIKDRPGNSKIFLNLANVYVNLNRHDEALYVLQKAVKLCGDDTGINLSLAELYWSKGEPLLAYGEYGKVIKRDKNNLRALMMLAEINLVTRKDPQQAYYFIKKAKRIAPNDTWIYSKMGRVCLAMNKGKKALEAFMQALELMPNNIEALDYINTVSTVKKIIIKDHVLSRAETLLPDKAFMADLKLKGQTPDVVDAGRFTNLLVEIKNSSEEMWPALGTTDGKYRTSVGYRWFDSNGNLALEGGRTPLPKDINPDTEILLNVNIMAPENPGDYVLKIDMVQEFVCWFEERGQGTHSIESSIKVRR